MLPADNTENGYMEDCEDDLNRACENVDTMKGDPRFVLSEISDNHNFLETKKDYAKSMVTGFIQLNGLTVGAVANCTEEYDEEGKKVAEHDAAVRLFRVRHAAERPRLRGAGLSALVPERGGREPRLRAGRHGPRL